MVDEVEDARDQARGAWREVQDARMAMQFRMDEAGEAFRAYEDAMLAVVEGPADIREGLIATVESLVKLHTKLIAVRSLADGLASDLREVLKSGQDGAK